MQINENFKNRIATTLLLLDEAICEFEQWANGRENKSVLYSERNNLSKDQRQEILLKIGEMQEVLKELQHELGLATKIHSGAQDIWGKCAVLSVNLEELKGKHLVGYGNPPKEMSEYLDPRIDRLIASVDYIFRLVEKSRT